MLDPLREAIATQYSAFRAARPRQVKGCACCTTDEQLAALVSGPRETLGPAELNFYAEKAITTVGSASDFRYYWPRLAELAINNEFLTDTEIVFGKPLYGNHHRWPVEEQEALKQLATAIGQWLAAEEQEAGDVDTWVCVVGLLTERLADPRDALAPLLSESRAACANLRGFVDWNREVVRKKRRLSNAFWENAPANAALLFEWITTEPRASETANGHDL